MSSQITLAICVYNAERYIKETLQAIVEQTFQEFDLWIVNDCCTDRTIDVARNLLDAKGIAYKIVDFEQNQGLAAARAYIEQNTTTKYILFVDADDIPLPPMVEKLYNKISSDSDLMAVGCYQKYINERGEELGGGIFIGAKTKEEFFVKAKSEKLIFMQPTAIINRDIVLSVGGRNVTGFPDGRPRYQDLCEDLDLWCRMSDLYTEKKAIVVVPEVLIHYRKHNQSMSVANINMALRMKHIKRNLKLRRAGSSEQSFVRFLETISPEELNQLKIDTENSDRLRNAVILMTNGDIIKGLFLMLKSFIANPRYFYQKIRANSGLFR